MIPEDIRSGGCTVGPTMRVELRKIPVEVVADASKTARTLVVVLDSLCTAWIGTWAWDFSRSWPLSMPFVEVFFHDTPYYCGGSTVQTANNWIHQARVPLGIMEPQNFHLPTTVMWIEMLNCESFFHGEGTVGNFLLPKIGRLLLVLRSDE